MKRSGLLAVVTDVRLPEREIVIHPNDGFDLGLMTTRHPVAVFLSGGVERLRAGGPPDLDAELLLKNECRQNTIELNDRTVAKLAGPRRALLVYESGRLLIVAANA